MICVIAKLPPDAAGRLDALRKTAVSGKRPAGPLYGHITIATCLSGNDEEFIRTCSGIICGTSPFSVRYERLEVLHETSIIAAVPSASDGLQSLHGSIASASGESLDRWTRGAEWYPHTTLLYDPAADLDALCREMQRCFIPFETRISRIEFSKAGETGYTIVKSIELK